MVYSSSINAPRVPVGWIGWVHPEEMVVFYCELYPFLLRHLAKLRKQRMILLDNFFCMKAVKHKSEEEEEKKQKTPCHWFHQP